MGPKMFPTVASTLLLHLQHNWLMLYFTMGPKMFPKVASPWGVRPPTEYTTPWQSIPQTVRGSVHGSYCGAHSSDQQRKLDADTSRVYRHTLTQTTQHPVYAMWPNKHISPRTAGQNARRLKSPLMLLPGQLHILAHTHTQTDRSKT